MMMVLAGLAVLFGIATLMAWVCAGAPTPLPFLRATLAPLSAYEFWVPPCPICWVVRVAALALVVTVVAGATA